MAARSFNYLIGSLVLIFLVGCASSLSKSTKQHRKTEIYTSFGYDNHLLPNLHLESDQRYQSCLWDEKWRCQYPDSPPEKNGFLESKLAASGLARDQLSPCGLEGSVEKRIEDCRRKNGSWSRFVNDKPVVFWSMVAIVEADGERYEVWRDNRSRLLWSDSTRRKYNWYRATGYAKEANTSILETQFISEPGVKNSVEPYPLDFALQPSSPMTVCRSAKTMSKAAGYSYVESPEVSRNGLYAFKGFLREEEADWKTPSRKDWLIAEVHGIRKVLPNMDRVFWSTTTGSDYRNSVWNYDGNYGAVDGTDRHISEYTRCVGIAK